VIGLKIGIVLLLVALAGMAGASSFIAIQEELQIDNGTLIVRTNLPDVKDWIRGDGPQELTRMASVTDETLYVSTYGLHDSRSARNYYRISANSKRAGAQHNLGVFNARQIESDIVVSSGGQVLATDYWLEGYGDLREIVLRDVNGHPAETWRLYGSDKFTIRTTMNASRQIDTDDWLPCI